MTVPTPEQMRARADENAEWAQTAFGLPGREQDARELLLNADMFRAAADEVDRLRGELADWKSYAGKEKKAWQAENVNRKVAEGESFQLRAVIENAPHDRDADCGFGVDPLDMGTCTCWKADAL